MIKVLHNEARNLILEAWDKLHNAKEIAERFIKEYFDDAEALNVAVADAHPKVSENIQEIIDLVSTLFEKGYAYEIDGDVYYATKKF